MRFNFVKVGIVIIDGYLNYYFSIVLEVLYVKDVGIVLFVIGIGDVNEMEFNEVVSNLNCIYVFFFM